MALPDEYIKKLEKMKLRRAELENEMAAAASDPEKLKKLGFKEFRN